MTAQAPLMELVTLRGGPLDGERRHVYRTMAEQFLRHPASGHLHLYRRGPDGVWRHTDEQETP